jgi:hydroxymethylglutaryl-CoA lyase
MDHRAMTAPATENGRAPSGVAICEVVARDGFQSEPRFVPTANKVKFINELSQCGLAKIEVTSFTSPKAIPALADAADVVAQIDRVPGVVYSALVPNMLGAARALASKIDEINLVMSVSETHNLTNLRMTREHSFRELKSVVKFAREAGVPVNVSLSCVFGCPMEGDVELEIAMSWAQRFAELQVAGITLCDTTGMAYPNQVEAAVGAFRAHFGELPLTLHFHNTRGMGLANVAMAVRAGARMFDSTLGGLGGCPYAPGATGNVCTEDTVHMLELMGYATGVDLARLIACARVLPRVVGHDVPGQIVKAGRRLDTHPAPAELESIRLRAAQREAMSDESTP